MKFPLSQMFTVRAAAFSTALVLAGSLGYERHQTGDMTAGLNCTTTMKPGYQDAVYAHIKEGRNLLPAEFDKGLRDIDRDYKVKTCRANIGALGFNF